MKPCALAIATFLYVFVCSCATLKPVETTGTGTIDDYKYVVIPQTGQLNSTSGLAIAGTYVSANRSVNPGDLISGQLAKAGFVRLPEIDRELADRTLIVNYGESGRRGTALGGYTIEVTIQLVDAATRTAICSCTAEGQGETEADDVRIAIRRCLASLLPAKTK